jgi:hypothetical protein
MSNNMEDQLISFETAKLANKVKFDENCSAYYEPDGYLNLARWKHVQNNQTLCYRKKSGYPYDSILAPTQSLLQKWLREIHNQFLYVENSNGHWNWVIENSNGYIEGELSSDNDYYPTFEEALEIGLLEALKIIE